MKDKNGFTLKVGDRIKCSLGECRINELIDEGTTRFGANVKVSDERGRSHTIALLLTGAEYIRPGRVEASDTSVKYGVR